ncbi:unnamed protein product [Psylliodes chrysocephalus]|uniref:Uncharacterized protein n=1 Tax=Psylliodes chrysocephalus TaxID=3402493 RepID=A0A9P0CZD1_9CUCU|nr:unnamed protein product [Psylliodes chrysocephala]
MDLDPEAECKLLLKLFKNVKNVKEIKDQLIKGELKCCIMKPTLILDPIQVVVAANKALVNEKLTTKTIYTEILFNLSPTKNISKSLQTFGIDEKDENLLVITLLKEGDKEDTDLFKKIDGEEVSLDKLKNYADMNLIKRTYKIADKETNVTPILNSLVSRIATKDFLSF